jgi:NAD(P)-dependent dehydrogenase (short-subunit alcohol dehydrogenase family)
MDLSGKRILITGAAGGLGGALALVCARGGAQLILLDKDRDGLGRASDRITDLGLPSPGLYPLDLAGVGIAEFEELTDIVQQQMGGLDALVHCAVEFDGLHPIDHVEPAQWLKSMQVNVNAPWLLSRICLPLLKASSDGRLFFMLEDIEKVSGAYWGVYGTGKTALAGLVRQFEQELEGTVAVRGIDPGPMRTGLRAKAYHAENPRELPEPAVAAEKIARMLTADLSGQDVLVSLSDWPSREAAER